VGYDLKYQVPTDHYPSPRTGRGRLQAVAPIPPAGSSARHVGDRSARTGRRWRQRRGNAPQSTTHTSKTRPVIPSRWGFSPRISAENPTYEGRTGLLHEVRLAGGARLRRRGAGRATAGATVGRRRGDGGATVGRRSGDGRATVGRRWGDGGDWGQELVCGDRTYQVPSLHNLCHVPDGATHHPHIGQESRLAPQQAGSPAVCKATHRLRGRPLPARRSGRGENEALLLGRQDS
jgi:hypothetical protein